MKTHLSIITVSSLDHKRLRKTLTSFKGLSTQIECILVCPEFDSESIKIFEEFRGFFKFRGKIIHDQKIGIYDAMNKGGQHATGKYVLFLNSGDCIFDNKALNRVLITLEYLTKSWVIVSGEFSWRSKQSLSLQNVNWFITQNPKGYVSHQTVLVRRSNFKELNGFDTRYRIAADTKLITQLHNIENPCFIDEVLVSVENPGVSSIFHRLGRIESYDIALRLLSPKLKLKAIFQIIIKENGYLFNKIVNLLIRKLHLN
jgi:hypothetical protein